MTLCTKPEGFQCANCPFGGFRVGTSGPPESEVVFVGESPGLDEIKTGIPFIGPSGKLLWSAWPGSRDDFYVTNALKCFPRLKGDAKQKKLPGAVQSCQQDVWDEVVSHPRRLIVALGNAAVWAVTGNFGLKITQIRGKLIPSAAAELGILPVLHPAAIIRGTGSVRQFKEDLQYGYKLLYPEAELPPIACNVVSPSGIKVYVQPSVHGWEYAREVLKCGAPDNDLIAADVETTGFDAIKDRMISFGVCSTPEDAGVWGRSPEAIKDIKLQVARYGSKVRWLWHNGKFDIGFFREAGLGPEHIRVDEDTMLQSYALDENRGVHDLEQVAGDTVGAPDWKHMIQPYLPKKASSYELVPEDVLNTYNGLDISATLQVHNALRPRIEADADLENLYTKVLIPASEMLSQVERRGFWVDQTRVEQNGIRLLAEMKKSLDALTEAAGHSVNPNSPDQVAKLLYDELKLKPKWGSLRDRSTKKEIIARLPPHPAVDALKAYRKAGKLHSTYVEPLMAMLDPRGRVHSTYLIHGTRTGRLSSRNPNMQNIPRLDWVRAMFAAPPGRILLEVDLNQAELRSLAILSGDQFLIDIYNSTDRSLHNEIAIELFGEGYTSEEKMRAKAVNFGIVYGREAPSIAEEFNIPMPEAQGYIDKWFERCKGAKEFIDKCRDAPVKGHVITTVFGRKKRHRLTPMAKLNELQNEAANFPHQAIASDINLLAACEQQPHLAKMDCHIVNLVHDSTVLDCPDDPKIYLKAGGMMREAMQRIPQEWGLVGVPFKGEFKIGSAWGFLKEVKHG